MNSIIEEFNGIDATPIQEKLSLINENRLVNNISNKTDKKLMEVESKKKV